MYKKKSTIMVTADQAMKYWMNSRHDLGSSNTYNLVSESDAKDNQSSHMKKAVEFNSHWELILYYSLQCMLFLRNDKSMGVSVKI